MKKYPVTILEIGALSGSRAVAAAGLALLVAKGLPEEARRPVGWSLLGTGTVFYLVLLADLMLRDRRRVPLNFP